ncbi:MAG: lysophospholipase [Oscillospiraceae bacterium]
MAICNEFTFLSSNGKIDIHAVFWQPEIGVRGIVQVSHGVAEYVRRYNHFAHFLCDNGFLVVGIDNLGHGESVEKTEDLGYWGNTGGWEIVVADMRKLYELTRERYPDVPYFLFGHSMGSFLSRTYIIRYSIGLDGVILSGTGQQARPILVAARAIAALEIRSHGASYKSERLNKIAFGKYNNGIAPARTLSDWISRDTAVVDAYNEDPLCGYIPSAGLFRDMADGILFISNPRNVKRMNKKMPVFFISGDRDPVGENGKSVIRAYRSFLDAGMTDVSMKLYHGARHELLNETNKEEVYGDILNWLESKL